MAPLTHLLSFQIYKLEVFETGSVEEIARATRTMEETFEAIEKKIEDRQSIVRKKTEDLHSKVEEKKNEKADMGQSIDSKKGEVKRQKVELKRLKEDTEFARVEYRLAYLFGI